MKKTRLFLSLLAAVALLVASVAAVTVHGGAVETAPAKTASKPLGLYVPTNLILDETGGAEHLVKSFICTAGDLSDVKQVDVTHNGEPLGNITNGNLDDRGTPLAKYGSFLNGNRDYICAQTPWIVLIYHLGGTASIKSMKLTSSNENNYHIAGVRYYVGQTLASLFDDGNLQYDTHGDATILQDEETVLDPDKDVLDRAITATFSTAVSGRYVGLVITRPHPTYSKGYSIARIGEFQVFGNLTEAEVPPDTRFTDPGTGIAVDVAQLDFDDKDFYDTVGGLKVTSEAVPAGKTSIDNNWLTADSPMYTLTLTDKSGAPITNEVLGDRQFTVYLPQSADHAQVVGKMEDGKFRRVVNSRALDGTVWASVGAGNGIKVALFRFTPVAEKPLLTKDPYDALKGGAGQ